VHLPVEADDHFDDHRVASDDVSHWARHATIQHTNNLTLLHCTVYLLTPITLGPDWPVVYCNVQKISI